MQVSFDYAAVTHPAAGVTQKDFTITTPHGASQGHLLEIDLTNPRVSLGLIHPTYVADHGTLSQMAAAQGAFAAINADFFDMAYWENNVGLATEAPDGPEIADGKFLKSAVPHAQRIGPQTSTGATGAEVFGVGADGRARVSEVTPGGFIEAPTLEATVGGYNTWALPQNSIGVFDAKWGPVTRKRSICGTDTSRTAPCLTSGVTEVIVGDGKVVSTSHTVGAGQLGRHEVALVGRENGSTELDKLTVGEPVDVQVRPVTEGLTPLRWAVGGFPILADSQTVAGLAQDLAPGTTAGASADGKTVYLAVVDGRSTASVGISIVEAAVMMRDFGAAQAVMLDRGGSTEMIAKPNTAADSYTIENVPSDGSERLIPNGIGVFVQ